MLSKRKPQQVQLSNYHYEKALQTECLLSVSINHPLPPLLAGEVDFCMAKRWRGCNYAGCNSARQLNSILFSSCRSCRDGHALSYVGEKKGRKDSPLKGDFDSPFELSGSNPLLKVFQAWLRQLKDKFDKN